MGRDVPLTRDPTIYKIVNQNWTHAFTGKIVAKDYVKFANIFSDFSDMNFLVTYNYV